MKTGDQKYQELIKTAGIGELLQTGLGLGMIGVGVPVSGLHYGRKGLEKAAPYIKRFAHDLPGKAWNTGRNFVHSAGNLLFTAEGQRASNEAIENFAAYGAPAMTATGTWLIHNAASRQGPQGFLNSLSPTQQGMLATGAGIGLGAAGIGLYNKFKKKDENNYPYGYYPKTGSLRRKIASLSKNASQLDMKVDQLEGVLKSLNAGTATFSDIGVAEDLAKAIGSMPGGQVGRAATAVASTPGIISNFRYNQAKGTTNTLIGGAATALSLIPAAAVAATHPLQTADFIGKAVDSGISKGVDMIKRLGGYKPSMTDTIMGGISKAIGNMSGTARGLLFGGLGAGLGALAAKNILNEGEAPAPVYNGGGMLW